MKKEHFRVAIFGSARIKRNDKNYKMISQLAELIGEKNIDMVTGGGPGIMEAANKGHKKGTKTAHSIGLLIKLPRGQKTNKFLNIKKDFHRFSRRLDEFMRLSNVVIVAPGGIGTLLELIYAWQLLQVKKVSNIPIILLGKQWKSLIKWMKKNQLKNDYIKKEDLDFVFPVNNIKEAMKIIDNTHELYLKDKRK
tara:strand:+ start:315 stop:896 length:582 start_codon:yes stop_codon:yes gene_type:complete